MFTTTYDNAPNVSATILMANTTEDLNHLYAANQHHFNRHPSLVYEMDRQIKKICTQRDRVPTLSEGDEGGWTEQAI